MNKADGFAQFLLYGMHLIKAEHNKLVFSTVPPSDKVNMISKNLEIKGWIAKVIRSENIIQFGRKNLPEFRSVFVEYQIVFQDAEQFREFVLYLMQYVVYSKGIQDRNQKILKQSLAL